MEPRLPWRVTHLSNVMARLSVFMNFSQLPCLLNVLPIPSFICNVWLRAQIIKLLSVHFFPQTFVTLFSTMLSYTLNLCSSLSVKNQVSCPYTQNIYYSFVYQHVLVKYLPYSIFMHADYILFFLSEEISMQTSYLEVNQFCQ